MDYQDEFKQTEIKEYLSEINWNKDDWSLSQIKQDLLKIIGEVPGVDIGRSTVHKLNEMTNADEAITKVTSVTVWYTVDDLASKMPFAQKVEILV